MRSAPLRGPAGAVLLSSVLSWLLWPPMHLLVPSFVCLVPVLVQLERTRGQVAVRRRYALGALYGVIGMAAPFFWIAVGMWRFRPAYTLMFAVVPLLGAIYGGALLAATGWLRERTRLPLWAVFPFLWTTLEWIIGHQGPLALPWLGLGTSLTGFPALVQIADVIGARGVTFLLAAANAALAEAWLMRARPRRAALRLATVALAVAAALSYGQLRVASLHIRPALRVALVQTDHDVHARWEPGRQDSLILDLIALSDDAARSGADLIVWPENAIPGALADAPAWDRLVQGHLVRAGRPVLAGVSERAPEGGNGSWFNAAVLLTPGPATGPPLSYHKRYLLPLVEYRGGIRPGAPDQGVMQVAGTPLAVLLCHEATREDLARASRLAGAAVIANIVNDRWFQGTGATIQHAAHLVMRAIETRTGIVRVANGGESMILDPRGRIVAHTRADKRAVLVGTVVVSRVVPLYARLGDWVGAIALTGTGAMLLIALSLSVPVPALRLLPAAGSPAT